MSRIAMVGILGLAFGCGSGGGDDILSKTTAFKDAMCKCADAECADKVAADMKKWRAEFKSAAKEAGKDIKPDPAIAEKLEDLKIEYTRCSLAAMKPKAAAK